MKLAIIGIRDVPGGSNVTAGADTFAFQLGQRLVDLGWHVSAFAQGKKQTKKINGINYIYRSTYGLVGFNTLLHTFKSCFYILRHKYDVVHIHNSGNAIIIPILKLFGIKSVVSVDGPDWKRAKWSWYARIYLYLTRLLAYRISDIIIFDNVFVRDETQKSHKYLSKKSYFVPYGADYQFRENGMNILKQFGLKEGMYYLFVGRFVPEKGIQYLINANNKLDIDKKVVIVGGDIGNMKYADYLKSLVKKDNVVFTGPLYNDDMGALMKHAFAYVQPSEVEGLSPVLLTAASMGIPTLASGIRENRFIGEDDMVYFKSGDQDDLADKMNMYENASHAELIDKAKHCQQRILAKFNWNEVSKKHNEIFQRLITNRKSESV